MHLDDAEALVFDDTQAEFVFPLPAAAQRPDALPQESSHIGADHQLDILVSPILREERYLVLDLLVQQYRRLDLARAVAGRADVRNLLHGHGTHPLAGDLHQPELGERQHRMLGLVGGHQLDHLVEERLFVLRLVQVDEIDDDNAPQIAQAQLAGDLLRSRQIDVHGGLLLVVLGLGAVARIDVDDVHRLGMLDDQVGAAAQRDVLGEERLDLLRDVEVVEDRDVAPVKQRRRKTLCRNCYKIWLSSFEHRFAGTRRTTE